MEERIRVLEQQAESFRGELNELKRFPVSNAHSPIVYIGMAADIIHHGHIGPDVHQFSSVERLFIKLFNINYTKGPILQCWCVAHTCVVFCVFLC